MDAEEDKVQPPEDLSQQSESFENPFLCSFLCAHRVSAVPLRVPRPN